MRLFDTFKKKEAVDKVQHKTFPIPQHLQTILIPIGEENSEFEVAGKIKCSCDCESFEVLESNGKQLVKAICKKCKKEFVLFDNGKHGWNGFVCGDDFLDREVPFNQSICSECEEDAFNITINIHSQGKEDFEEECLSNDDSFTLEDWVNAFEWITISLSCIKCGFTDKDWLDLETM